MERLTAASPETRSADLVADNIERLKALFPDFPDLITEDANGTAVNVDVLKALVGDASVTDADEKYGLNWHGKRRARQLALTPGTGTLRPCPEDSVDWDTTRNLMIEGDNLEVLKLLQKSYAGKVKLIHIDPPYNTGKDFVYPDHFQDNIQHYLELTGQAEGGEKTSSNTEASGRFHTDWLNMMYPRLKLAHGLLREDGLIVIHIDEHEVHSLVLMLREIFGEENELGVLVWDKRNPKGDARGIAYQHESIVIFARDAEKLLEKSPLKRPKRNAQRMLDAAKQAVATADGIAQANETYRSWLKTQTTLSGGEAMYDRISDEGRVYRLVSMAWPNKKKAPDEYFLPLIHPVTGKPCPIPERGWRNPPDTMESLLGQGRIQFGPDERTQPQRIYFLDENMHENVPSILPYGGSDDALLKTLGIPFDQPKPVEFLASILAWCSGGHDIVVDFFAGSGTTAHAVMALNARDGATRRFVLVQLPEKLDEDRKEQSEARKFCDALGKAPNIAEITKERLRRASAAIHALHPDCKGDLGFKAFKLDSSNFRAWDASIDQLAEDLIDATERIKRDRTPLDVVYEIILKLGLDPGTSLTVRQVAGNALYITRDGVLLAYLAEHIAEDDVEGIASGILDIRRELNPAGDITCIFNDQGFSNDVAKLNMYSILQQNGISRVKSV
ncbi:site-specific DNA-methyltransferase [Castellaniella hirudinis]|uniref:site-specific DNA-methyltransferase (adenine-specific) n=1 Tax=Castellaniella hirudinis TaxID=1144617 RepID=A0ABV8S3A9_9BURK